MDRYEREEKYRKLLPKGWSDNSLPDNIHRLHSLMQEENNLRHELALWVKNPRIIFAMGKVLSLTTTGGQVPTTEQFIEAKKMQDEKIAEVRREISSIKAEWQNASPDGLEILNLPSDAKPYQVYCAYAILDDQYTFGADHWDRQLDKLREERNIGGQEWVRALWEYEMKVLAKERINAAYQQLQQSIGSTKPSFWQMLWAR